MTKKIIMVCTFTVLFIFGIILILKSNAWAWGDFISMNIVGAIISVISGIGLLCELYNNKKNYQFQDISTTPCMTPFTACSEYMY